MRDPVVMRLLGILTVSVSVSCYSLVVSQSITAGTNRVKGFWNLYALFLISTSESTVISPKRFNLKKKEKKKEKLMPRKLLTRNEKFRRKCLAFLQSDRFLHYFGETFVKGFKSIPDFTEEF